MVLNKNLSKLFNEECSSAGHDLGYYVDKGKEILDKDFFEDWEKQLASSVGKPSLYGNMLYAAVLDIIEALTDNSAKSFTIALMILAAQNHSGLSYNFVLSLVIHFSKYGKEFVEYAEDVQKVIGHV